MGALLPSVVLAWVLGPEWYCALITLPIGGLLVKYLVDFEEDVGAQSDCIAHLLDDRNRLEADVDRLTRLLNRRSSPLADVHVPDSLPEDVE
jgi:hypothetical protein